MKKISCLCIAAALLAACRPDAPQDLQDEPALQCGVGLTKDYGSIVNDISVTTARWGFAVALNSRYANDRGRVEMLTSDGYSHALPAEIGVSGGDIVTLADQRLMVIDYSGNETVLLSADGQPLAKVEDQPYHGFLTAAGSSRADWALWNEAAWNGSGYDRSSWLGRIVDGRVEVVSGLPFAEDIRSAAAIADGDRELILVGTDAVKCRDGNCTKLVFRLLTVAGGQVSVAEIEPDGAMVDSDQYFGRTKVMAAGSRFAVLWSRNGYDYDADQLLTFVGADGAVTGTADIPAADDIVWTGSGFASVAVRLGDDDRGRDIVMRLLDENGRVTGAGVIADVSETEEVNSRPNLNGVGGTRFAVSWLLWDKKGAEPVNRPLLTFVDCDP